MTFFRFVKLVVNNLKWLLGIAIFMAGLVFFFTKEGPKEYTTHTLFKLTQYMLIRLSQKFKIDQV